MSQLITNLTEGNKIKILETINGESSHRGFILIASPDNNPYGTNKCLFQREYALETIRIYEPDPDTFYENSGIDTYLSTTYAGRFSASILQNIADTTIRCYAVTSQEFYTTSKKFFLGSYNEYGATTVIPQDDTSVIPYFSNSEVRYRPREGYAALKNATRTILGTNSVYGISSNGAISSGTLYNNPEYVPLFNIFATALVSDEPDENGYYNLIPDPTDPYVYVRFDCSLGTVAKTPLEIRVDLTTEGNPEITLLQVCNNYGDETPTWETMTVGAKHTFTNTTKTADNWEIGVKVEARGENTIRVYEPFAIVQTEL